MPSTKQQNSFPLRMPDELRQQLEAMAKEDGRSVNALIIALLQSSLDNKNQPLSKIPSGELLAEVLLRYGKEVRIEISGSAAQDLAKK